jgi:hypothetical protein
MPSIESIFIRIIRVLFGHRPKDWYTECPAIKTEMETRVRILNLRIEILTSIRTYCEVGNKDKLKKVYLAIKNLEETEGA